MREPGREDEREYVVTMEERGGVAAWGERTSQQGMERVEDGRTKEGRMSRSRDAN